MSGDRDLIKLIGKMQQLHQLIICTIAFLIFACLALNSCGVVESANVAHLHWYMQDTPFNGRTPSAIPVTAYNPADLQNELNNFLFGQIFVFDDPLTYKPSLTSACFGRAQGTYTYVSRDGFVAYLSYTVSIGAGKYKGSTLNIQGASLYSGMAGTEKYAIVGGTGDFMLARGILNEQVVSLFGPLNASATISQHATVYLQ